MHSLIEIIESDVLTHVNKQRMVRKAFATIALLRNFWSLMPTQPGTSALTCNNAETIRSATKNPGQTAKRARSHPCVELLCTVGSLTSRHSCHIAGLRPPQIFTVAVVGVIIGTGARLVTHRFPTKAPSYNYTQITNMLSTGWQIPHCNSCSSHAYVHMICVIFSCFDSKPVSTYLLNSIWCPKELAKKNKGTLCCCCPVRVLR